jgi:hypothetical protein
VENDSGGSAPVVIGAAVIALNPPCLAAMIGLGLLRIIFPFHLAV